MSEKLDAFLITLNEEELIGYCLESLCPISDLLGTLSIVDNGSTDATLDIVFSFRDRLPITFQRSVSNAHHGNLRNLALSKCRLPWIFYIDSDETITRNFHDWLVSDALEEQDIHDFLKYSTILDRFHYTLGGEGPSTRLFRNLDGVHFPQNVHTYPTHPGLVRKRMATNVYMFDHTSTKSREALIAKGWRYQWAQGTVGIGPWNEYIARVDDAIARNTIAEFDERMKSLIFTGP